MSHQNLPSRPRATPRLSSDDAPEDPPPVDEPPVPTLPACDELPKSRERARGTSYVTAPPEALSADDPLLDFAPVPHVAPRRNSITPDRQRRFIAHLAATGIVTHAAKHIGASMEALYKLRQKPGAEEFRAAWDMAVDRGIARLEDCALARAIAGEERMVVSAGKLVGTERRHNEALVMFFLRHRRADRYGSDVRPGHPLYERIRAEVLADMRAEAEAEEESVLESLNLKLEAMRLREEETRRMLEEE
ncbi:hypothetical protein OZN62_13630 [Aurantiacibacter sp. MUD11]|uniref:hypothetical protein n=1 Tax=Aurantiacibacter sp. MUD11 TaxID=3003265 RepID=UPI0022A9F71E|nr:hypothetical protein [Aurantiacibacter sp. MUD11]WAT17937.1 hypothetical protein OZN62_13630 [Aurantiacibacter sp. MUD11]